MCSCHLWLLLLWLPLLLLLLLLFVAVLFLLIVIFHKVFAAVVVDLVVVVVDFIVVFVVVVLVNNMNYFLTQSLFETLPYPDPATVISCCCCCCCCCCCYCCCCQESFPCLLWRPTSPTSQKWILEVVVVVEDLEVLNWNNHLWLLAPDDTDLKQIFIYCSGHLIHC